MPLFFILNNLLFILFFNTTTAENKGFQKGIEKGKLEVARNLLDVLDDETISQKTGLSIDDIKKLRSNIGGIKI